MASQKRISSTFNGNGTKKYTDFQMVKKSGYPFLRLSLNTQQSGIFETYAMMGMHTNSPRIPGTNPRWKKKAKYCEPPGMLFNVIGTIKAKNKKDWLGNIEFIA